MSNIRIGQGYDVHAFGDGDHVMLGGVRVPHERGVLAHSDGDDRCCHALSAMRCSARWRWATSAGVRQPIRSGKTPTAARSFATAMR